MIRFVYFDVGGVVMRDFNKTNHWEEYKKEIGIKPHQDSEFDAYFDDREKELFRGKEADSLVPEINKKFGTNLPQNYSIIKAFAKRFAKNESIYPVIETVQKVAKTGLLTNNYPRLLRLELETGLVPDMGWNAIVDSSEVGVAKPERKIFKISESMSGFSGNDILFIEDGKRNVDTAEKFGWTTFLYDPANTEKSSEQLLEYFRELTGSS